MCCLIGHLIRFIIYRIHKYASCSNECFVLALVYIDRLIQRNNFLLTELNVHRVVITAVLLAAKFFDDAYYNNAYYAKVGGVLVSEMNGLEVDFLFRINFSLHVTPELFHKYRAELASHSAAAGVSLPEMSPALHMRPTGYHGEMTSTGGVVARRTEARPMQTDMTERRNASNGAFITPSPPSTSARASAFPSDPSSNGYASATTESFPQGYDYDSHAKVYPITQPIPCISTDAPYAYGMNQASGMGTDDQFVFVDSITYPVGLPQHHPATVPETGSLGKLLQHYHASAPNGYHRPHAQSDPGYVDSRAHDGTVQHFVGGRTMVPGVSGGL